MSVQTLLVKDGDGNDKYIQVVGAGTSADPHRTVNKIDLGFNGQKDSFGRLRTSNVTTLFDSKQLYDNQPLFWDEVDSGGGESSTHSTTTADTTMATVASGEYVIRQTFQRFNYQTGKSHQIFMTFANFEQETNITKRVGYFSSSTVAPYSTSLDGLFLESGASGVYIKVYRTGNEVFSIAQADWDDPMDGSGLSGVTLDFSKGQILMIDFEWLGSGNPQFSFVVDSVIHKVHLCKNANVNASVYMSSPNQPLRYEIVQSGAGSGSFVQICATVGSEGALNTIGKTGHFGQEVTSLTLANTATTYVLLAMRLKSTHPDAVIELIKASLLETSAKRIHWEIKLNPTLSAGSYSWTGLTNYAIEYNIGDATQAVTGGTDLAGGYIDGDGITTELENAVRIGMDIAGAMDILVLSGRPVSANAVVYSSIDFKQL